MLETSKDLLYVAIAFCVLWLTIFMCWMIYYFAMILKKVNHVMETFTKTLDAVRSFFEKAKEKISSAGTAIATAVELGKRVADYVEDKKEKKKSGQKKK